MSPATYAATLPLAAALFLGLDVLIRWSLGDALAKESHLVRVWALLQIQVFAVIYFSRRSQQALESRVRELERESQG